MAHKAGIPPGGSTTVARQTAKRNKRARAGIYSRDPYVHEGWRAFHRLPAADLRTPDDGDETRLCMSLRQPTAEKQCCQCRSGRQSTLLIRSRMSVAFDDVEVTPWRGQAMMREVPLRSTTIVGADLSMSRGVPAHPWAKRAQGHRRLEEAQRSVTNVRASGPPDARNLEARQAE